MARSLRTAAAQCATPRCAASGGWLMNSRFRPCRCRRRCRRRRPAPAACSAVGLRQALQRGDHLVAAGQLGTAGVGAELAPAAEPHRDHRGEQAEHDVEHEHDDVVDRSSGRRSRLPLIAESMIRPTTRARKITKVLSTPWIRAMVTMSPLATWLTSCASTASASSRLIARSRPVDTATRELLRVGPVAKALISGRVVDADFRHLDAGGLGLAAHGVEQPELAFAARLVDQLHAGGALGHPLGDHQRE